jgi:hypothetical protein
MGKPVESFQSSVFSPQESDADQIPIPWRHNGAVFYNYSLPSELLNAVVGFPTVATWKF